MQAAGACASPCFLSLANRPSSTTELNMSSTNIGKHSAYGSPYITSFTSLLATCRAHSHPLSVAQICGDWVTSRRILRIYFFRIIPSAEKIFYFFCNFRKIYLVFWYLRFEIIFQMWFKIRISKVNGYDIYQYKMVTE